MAYYDLLIENDHILYCKYITPEKYEFQSHLYGPWGATVKDITFNLSRYGDFVKCTVPPVSDTLVGATPITAYAPADDFPTEYRPSVEQDIPLYVEDNGARKLGFMHIQTDGRYLIYSGVPSANFTAGTVGTLGNTIQWYL